MDWRLSTYLLLSILFVLSVWFLYERNHLLDESRESWHEGFDIGRDIAMEFCEDRINEVRIACQFEKDSLANDLKSEIEELNNSLSLCYNSKPLFQTIAEDFAASHEYTEDYVCANFTHDLVRILRAVGYDAYYIKGYALWCNPEEDPIYHCRHDWTRVCVNIESTTGEILDPDYYRKNYDEIFR